MPRWVAARPPMAGPTATLRSCAPCTRAMAVATFSRGADTLATAIAMGVKPAKRPWRKRAAKSCCTEVTRPMAAMITVKPASERISIILRPKRSARRPKRGAQAGDGGRDGGEHARPERDRGGVGHAQLAHVEGEERREELEAHEGDEHGHRQGPDIDLPTGGPPHPTTIPPFAIFGDGEFVYTSRGRSAHGPPQARRRDDDARDQHLLPGDHAAVVVPAARRRGRRRRVHRHEHPARRLPRRGQEGWGRDRGAGSGGRASLRLRGEGRLRGHG